MTYMEDSNPVFEDCKKGNIEGVKAYLEKGGSVYAESAKNIPLIATACARGHLGIVDLLLRRGLDPNRPFNVYKQAPLFQTIEYDQLAVAERLIEGGADVNARDEFDAVPINFAVGGGQKDFFDLFVKAGADLEVVDRQGEGLIQTAARNNQVEMLEALKETRGGISDIIDKRLRPDGGETPLSLAVRRGNVEAAEWLIQHGADPAVEVSFTRDTLPQIAKENGHPRVLELLEKHLKQNRSSK